MQTQLIYTEYNEDFAFRIAIEAFKNGEVVVFPTDTIYGLGCIYNSEHSVKEIYRLKTRSFNKPLAAYFSDIDMMQGYIKNYTPLLQEICEKFLPGPLTIVTEKNEKIADYVTSDANTIGIRIPKYDFILDVIDALNVPIVGTSANVSNHQSAKTAREALKIFHNQIPYVFEDDHSIHGIESTVISVVKDKVKLLREGAIPFLNILNSLSL